MVSERAGMAADEDVDGLCAGADERLAARQINAAIRGIFVNDIGSIQSSALTGLLSIKI
jgi:hypothetical protein